MSDVAWLHAFSLVYVLLAALFCFIISSRMYFRDYLSARLEGFYANGAFESAKAILRAIWLSVNIERNKSQQLRYSNLKVYDEEQRRLIDRLLFVYVIDRGAVSAAFEEMRARRAWNELDYVEFGKELEHWNDEIWSTVRTFDETHGERHFLKTFADGLLAKPHSVLFLSGRKKHFFAQIKAEIQEAGLGSDPSNQMLPVMSANSAA